MSIISIKDEHTGKDIQVEAEFIFRFNDPQWKILADNELKQTVNGDFMTL